MENVSLSHSTPTHTIFFSHKHHDEPVTKEIIALLRRHTENVQCFVSEDIEKGTNWRRAIAEHLALSSFLVLVFSDPEEDWGWCLYETGFFDALSQVPNANSIRRIYCLHNSSTPPPSPISDLQAVPATPKDIKQWLDEVFDHTHQTKKEFREDIPALAEKICALFAKRHQPIYSAKSISLSVRRSSLKSPEELPGDTTIKADGGVIDELFGIKNELIDWNSAKKKISQSPNSSEVNFRTWKEISRAAHAICRDDRVPTIQGTLFVGQGPKRYRPVISHAGEATPDVINCEIMLVEEVGGPLQNVNKDIGVLLVTIRMAVRIRWEIVRPFAAKVRFLAKIEPQKLRLDLQTCLNNIFSEAEFRGSYSPADVWTAFDSEDDKSRMLEMIAGSRSVFDKLWRGIGLNGDAETFGEVSPQPFTEAELADLDAGLAELAAMNRDFLKMAVARADVLIQQELGGTGR
jgi:hypothetical protein